MHEGADFFLTIEDNAAVETRRLLASDMGNNSLLVGGKCAVAGLAGALAAVDDPAAAETLELNAESCILVFGSEGDTNPQRYRELVSRLADEVRAADAIRVKGRM